MRAGRALLVFLLLWGPSGCSFLLVQGPPPKDENSRRPLFDSECTLLGFLVCLLLWLSLPTSAQLVGIVWLGIGLGFGLWYTRAFTVSNRDPAAAPESDDDAH